MQLAGVDAASIGMEDHGDPDDISFSQLVAGMKETSGMSIAGNMLKEAIEKGAHKRDIDGNTTRSYDLRETVKKVFDDDWKSVNRNGGISFLAGKK